MLFARFNITSIPNMEETVTRKTINYGGIPYTSILSKLEETDMEDTDDYNDNGVEYKYKSSARAEIIDRNPDKPYFESDQARRNPVMSRQKLNLQYNGTRGNSAELPAHPEMFVGFIDQDPRGINLDPILAKSREHLSGSKAARMQVSMGNNDDNLIVERPMTNYEIDENRKKMHNFSRKNTKVFSRDRLGQSTNNNSMNTNFRPQHFGTSENTLNYESFREATNLKSDGKPDDTMLIYNKVDNDSEFRQQMHSLLMKSKILDEDIHQLRTQVAYELAAGQGFQNSNVHHVQGEISKLKYMTEQMQLLHSQITSLNVTSATPQKISQAKYLSDQLQSLGEHTKNLNFKGATPEEARQIQNYVDHMTELYTSIQNVNQKSAEKISKQISRLTNQDTTQEMNSHYYTTKYKSARIDAKQIHDYSEVSTFDQTTTADNTARVMNSKVDITKTIIDNITDNSITNTTSQKINKTTQKRLTDVTKMNDGFETVSYAGAVKKSGFITGTPDMKFEETVVRGNNKLAREQIRNNFITHQNMSHGDNMQTHDRTGGVLPLSLRKEQIKNAYSV